MYKLHLALKMETVNRKVKHFVRITFIPTFGCTVIMGLGVDAAGEFNCTLLLLTRLEVYIVTAGS